MRAAGLLGLCLALAAGIAPGMAPAQDRTPPATNQGGTGGGGSDMRQGLDQMQGGARQMMEGLLQQFGPQLDRLQKLAEMLGDLQNYDWPPERLPNGDIILHRSADAPPVTDGPPQADTVPPRKDPGQMAPDGGEGALPPPGPDGRRTIPDSPAPAPERPDGITPLVPGVPPPKNGIEL